MNIKDLRVDRVRVNLADEPFPVLVEEENIPARVNVENRYLPVSPVYPLRYFPETHDAHANRYKYTLSKLQPLITAKARQLSGYLKNKRVFAVVVPFFKEESSFISIATESSIALKRMGYIPLIVLASNQPTRLPLQGASRLYFESIGLAQQALGIKGAGALWQDLFVADIPTEGINGTKHWMIEKFLNIHCGSILCRELIELGIDIERVAFIEGDVEDVDQWWSKIELALDNLKDICILDFEVGVRPEGSTEDPRCDLDSSDAIYARFLAEPLTGILMGTVIKQVFGGNFILSQAALRAFCDRLQTSEHKESLVETWLLDLPPSCAIRTLNVGNKIHLPALKEYSFATDDKFIKWSIDLFSSIYRWKERHTGLAIRPILSSYASSKSRFSPEDIDRARERSREALRNFEYCSSIYLEVLTSTEIEQWNLGLPLIREWTEGHTERPRASIEQDLWIASMLEFFLAHKEAPTEAQEERLFGLRVLFTLMASSLWSEKPRPIKPWKVGPLSESVLKRNGLL
jgi:hypothetical protein